MLKNMKLGIAPIGWTNDDMPDLGRENTFEQCISEMALAGFKGTEVGNKYPSDVAVLKKALNLRQLEVANCWFSTYLLTKPYADVEKEFFEKCKWLSLLGAKVIGVSEQSHSIQGQIDTPVFGNKYNMNSQEWKRLCDGLNALGKKALEYGISLTYHHHMGTVVQSEGETDKLMEMTDPEYVGLLYDSGHFAYAGADPQKMLKKHIKRVKHVHLKDVRENIITKVKVEKLSFLKGVRLGTFTVPGDGSIDFKAIFKKLHQASYSGWAIVEAEQDPSLANPFEYALKAKQYISTILK